MALRSLRGRPFREDAEGPRRAAGGVRVRRRIVRSAERLITTARAVIQLVGKEVRRSAAIRTEVEVDGLGDTARHRTAVIGGDGAVVPISDRSVDDRAIGPRREFERIRSQTAKRFLNVAENDRTTERRK